MLLLILADLTSEPHKYGIGVVGGIIIGVIIAKLVNRRK